MRTVLIVDDEDSIARTRADFLRRHSGQATVVHIASSGEEGVATWLEHRSEIDVVLMDLGLAGIGGEAAMDAIRELVSPEDAPPSFILVTGHQTELLPAPVLMKPFSLARLGDAVDAAVMARDAAILARAARDTGSPRVTRK